MPLLKIVKNLNLQCSMQTIARILHDAGLCFCVAALKPFLSPSNIYGQKDWSDQYKVKNTYFWRRIIFSDEMSVEVGKQSRQVRVWRCADERYKHECLQPNFRSGRVLVMVWSCYVDTIKGPMVFFDDYKDPKEKITKIIYTKVLDDHLVPFIAAARLLLDSHPIFQHDNAPIHKVSNWLKSKKIDYMNWPSRSPDLNPIENI